MYNEAGNIGSVLKDLTSYVPTCSPGEIIIVNDGSTDNSAAIVEKFIEEGHEMIQLIHHDRNKGYGAALKTGIKISKLDYVATFDADGQHDLSQLSLLVSSFPFDLVIGERRFNEGAPISRAAGRIFFKLFTWFFIGSNLRDLSSGLRVWKKKEIIKFFDYLPDGFSFSTTSLLLSKIMNLNVIWIPIKIKPRSNGKSLLTLRKGISFLKLVFKIMLLFKPLRLFIPIASSLFFVSIYFFVYSLVKVDEVSIKSLITGLSAINIFLTGLITQSLAVDRRRTLK
jgi:glycosyltransferase involved in cell wall biosynthesis